MNSPLVLNIQHRLSLNMPKAASHSTLDGSIPTALFLKKIPNVLLEIIESFFSYREIASLMAVSKTYNLYYSNPKIWEMVSSYFIKKHRLEIERTKLALETYHAQNTLICFSYWDSYKNFIQSNQHYSFIKSAKNLVKTLNKDSKKILGIKPKIALLNGISLSIIPYELTYLSKSLTHLDISNNKIKNFPNVITTLPKLTYLNLSDNPIILDFPIEWAQKATKLLTLGLSNVNLKLWPKRINHFPCLTGLNLSRNYIKKVSEDSFLLFSSSQVSLTSLLELNLSYNKLEQITIPNKIALNKLNFRKNEITEWPDIKNLTQLAIIDISRNPVNALPDNLFEYHRLQNICIVGTNINYLPCEFINQMNTQTKLLGPFEIPENVAFQEYLNNLLKEKSMRYIWEKGTE